jgi:hypothetical protein
MCACDPSTPEAEAEESEIQASLSYIGRPCLKKKKINKWHLIL